MNNLNLVDSNGKKQEIIFENIVKSTEVQYRLLISLRSVGDRVELRISTANDLLLL